MNSSKFYKVLFCSLAIVSLILTIGLVTVFIQVKRELVAMEVRDSELRSQVRTMSEEFDYLQEYLDRMIRDPEFQERIVRQKMGYARPNEIIYHFEDEHPPEP